MKDYPAFAHHGATNGVTGSCHRYMATADTHLLIDCGLFQGEDIKADSFERHQIEFDISQVIALLVTHVHIDHIGRLPYLLAAGFKGPIICSEPSARLLPLVIEDALKVGFTRDQALIGRFLASVDQYLVAVPYKTWHTVFDNNDVLVTVRLQRAGHILGSAYIEIDTLYKDQNRHHRSVFSGDLGAPHAPLLPAPKSPYAADTLIIESTYGNRLHENRRERRLRLKSVLEHALQNKGTVMIPAFSIGRTQELLYELEGLIHEGRSQQTGRSKQTGQSDQPSQSAVDWENLQVIVDSPLAARFTAVYRELKPFWDAEAQRRLRAGRHPLNFENLYTVDSHQEHQQTVEHLARTRQAAVVIAASGMAAGGRIVNYLKAMLADPVHSVLFAGYQARGTTGHQLQRIARGRAEPVVTLDGERIEVRAMLTSIGGYSAHADQKDLLNFVRRMHRWPSQIRIVHGEQKAREALKAAYETLASSEGKQVQIVLPDQV
jgi:metallo-beta-lactamase family protein